MCEDARTSEAMDSRYRVVGKVLGDAMMEDWLQARAIPTVTR